MTSRIAFEPIVFGAVMLYVAATPLLLLDRSLESLHSEGDAVPA